MTKTPSIILLYVSCLVIQMMDVLAITTIPFDSSLVLGNLVDTTKIANLETIAQLQVEVDALQDSYNALLQQRLSLDMSMAELDELGLDKGNLDDTRKDLNTKIPATLQELVKARMHYQDEYLKQVMTNGQTKIGDEPESPLDFEKSKLQSMPISSDTMKMDVQYFRAETRNQDSSDYVSTLSRYISSSVGSVFGAKAAANAAAEASKTASYQQDHYELLGTIVIFVASTHKNAKLFSPTIYDPDKLVDAWNAKHSDKDSLKLPQQGPELCKEWAADMKTSDKSGADANTIHILNGVTYGSSFIGYIHLIHTTDTRSHEEVDAAAKTAEAQATWNNFLTKVTGGFGMDAKSANDIRSLTSSDQIASHVAITSMGIVPSLASQSLDTALHTYTDFSSNEVNNKLAALGNSMTNKVPNMDGGARESIAAGQINGMERSKISSVISAVSESDKASNNIIDLNSVMLALDDYIKQVRVADGGVPVNFYVTKLNKNRVLELWFKEYLSECYNSVLVPPTTPSDTPTPAPAK